MKNKEIEYCELVAPLSEGELRMIFPKEMTIADILLFEEWLKLMKKGLKYRLERIEKEYYKGLKIGNPSIFAYRSLKIPKLSGTVLF